ncbi:tyrosine-type recombinase/integrase [Citrobacter freundii]|uniref:tyrosine-type recombinase/integrase n=1 Tax=Citrobacter freundii TaxID=546 RepID=UPI0020903DEC|nr:tyrosine-type recombinase/integrase [Citrobacter freundii]MCO5620132.1 tyrosine-type recombinase/integrase [Citrobacter freundii]MCO5631428.1 tyrosine-type recombinase/integrase [Citrobacter freundii]MCO5636869.1 tyrosine-type recombinase/integrase [Citrobacter freundii]MCO5641782.1 tyrosine-type recombinase/integrase [Citrobacter freundii]
MNYPNIIDMNSSFPELTGITPEEVAQNLRKFMADKEAYSENTFKKLTSVVRAWAVWCQKNQIAPLPIMPDCARAYFLELHEAGVASTSITNHFAMLNMLARICGLPDLKNSTEVQLAMKKIRRQSVLGGEKTGQAVPFRLADLQLASHILSQSDRLADLRNLAFLYVAYNSLLRIQEIARIRVKDLSVNDERIIMDISHTKTVVTASGVIKHLSVPASNMLKKWLNTSELISHPDAVVFCRVFKNDRVQISETPMTTPSLEKIFQDTWRLLGRPSQTTNKGRYEMWSGHSARVGAAQDMAERGVSMAQIMHEGTWSKPETVMRYLRRLKNENSAMSDIMER